jgi:hypothetical protein
MSGMRCEIQRPVARWRGRIGRVVCALGPRRVFRITMVTVIATTLGFVSRGRYRGGCCCGVSRERVAYHTAEQLAVEGYGNWALAHPERTCPTSIDELARSLGIDDAGDPWDRTYRVICTNDRVVIVSAGPDHVFGTPDDISTLRAPE